MASSSIFRTAACLALGALPLFAFFACSSSDTPPKASLAAGCSINSDCTEPLVCAFRKCHTACTSTRDCPTGERCVASDRPFHVCQLEQESRCTYNSECPDKQVCGVDGHCRDQCATVRDCLLDQTCVSGTCADKDELEGGTLPVTNDAAAEASGQPCAYNSDCASPFVCRSGLCSYECVGDRDCAPLHTCVENRCRVEVCGGPDGGAGDLATIDGGGAPCTFDSQCPTELVCRDGFCNCGCLADSECAGGETCVAHKCAVLVCGGPNGPLAALAGIDGGGASCTHDSQCPTPLVCHGGHCNCECVTAADCAGDAQICDSSTGRCQ